MQKRTLYINGTLRTVIVDPEASLGDVVRKQLALTGTKVSCNDGHCGACSVIVNGKLTLACITKMSRVPDGAQIVTVEGIGQPGKLDPIQAAIMMHGATQCGFCTPGFVVAVRAFLDKHPQATEAEIRGGLNGNICRCGTYANIVQAAIAVVKGGK